VTCVSTDLGNQTRHPSTLVVVTPQLGRVLSHLPLSREFDALSFPQFQLTVPSTLARRALVIGGGDRTFAMRRSAKSVTCDGPEIEGGGVRHDLWKYDTIRHTDFFYARMDIPKGGRRGVIHI